MKPTPFPENSTIARSCRRKPLCSKVFQTGFALLLATCIFSPHRGFSEENPTSADSSTLSDAEKVEKDYAELQIPQGYSKNLRWDLNLETKGKYGSTILWKSGNPQYLQDNGKLRQLAPRQGPPVMVKFGAIIRSGNVTKNKVFDLHIARQEQKFDGYLFAYFEGSGPKEIQEQLRFGVSADAVNWSALNNNQPVLESARISETGGIRDPHILRGEDGKTYYMVATDMYVAKNGWDNNPGIILLKSTDLINWTHGIINLEKTYPEKFKHTKWVWAPQTIYDPTADKYLVYFTVRSHDNQNLDFYSAHANDDFTGFVEEPKLMFRAKYGAIDGDIIYKDGVYHFFYKGNTKDERGKEFQNGIQQATSKSLQGPWVEDFKYLDAYSKRRVVVEGSGVFKLNDSDKYVLMYDLYTNLRYEFQYSTDLFDFDSTPKSFTKNFNPRHGTVMGITREEAKQLNDKWGGVPKELLNSH
jgi:Glycosyl hydrolases family 43